MLKICADSIVNFTDTVNCKYGCTYQMNQKTVSILSNNEACIKWANEQYSNFFNIVCQADNPNHTRIFACFFDELPVSEIRESEYEKCTLYFNQIGFTNIEKNNIFILPQKYIHYFDGEDHRLILSKSLFDNIRTPSRILREILINENNIDYLRIHSACVTNNNQSYLIVGAKDSGKSTMLCNLLFSKARFCSNDRTLIYCKKNKIYTLGLPVSVRLNKAMIKYFPSFNKINLNQLDFRDINENTIEKIEFTPNEIVKLFGTEIENNMRLKGIIVPNFKRGEKLTVDVMKYRNNILYDNLLMPDPAFPQYYSSKYKQFNKRKILNELVLLPWIKISGDFYGIGINDIENIFKEIGHE